MVPLGLSHFRRPPRPDINSLDGISKLAGRLAEALGTGLSAVQPAPWRVTVDGIGQSATGPAEGEGMLLRFESGRGSLTALLALDRQTVSALVEVAMGGTGGEAAFETSGRPLSKIERRLLDLAYAGMANCLAAMLGEFFGRSFSLFDGSQTPELDQSSGLAQFRFVSTIFTYDGEITLTFSRGELEAQITAAQLEELEEARPHDTEKLQQEVGKSELTLTVTLAPETLTVDILAAMRPGTLIPLESLASAPVTVWSAGVPAYEAKLGRSGDKFAITITSALG